MFEKEKTAKIENFCQKNDQKPRIFEKKAKKTENFDSFFFRSDRPVEESRLGRQPVPVNPTGFHL